MIGAERAKENIGLMPKDFIEEINNSIVETSTFSHFLKLRDEKYDTRKFNRFSPRIKEELREKGYKVYTEERFEPSNIRSSKKYQIYLVVDWSKSFKASYRDLKDRFGFCGNYIFVH